MNRKEMAQRVAEKHGGISVSEASETINKILELLTDALKSEDKLVISGFGTFKWKTTRKRKIVLPNGRETESKLKRRVWFQPAQRLKDRLNQPGEIHAGNE
ncbi:MAG: hypothetical protein CSA81_08590 [Acidobacteria bacterium]|nr:MAG: hypothetical protein CSA81_08590 [Acidobacteriota bacterium]PIE90340.1 MAG: hypothetical protein CR997_07040 [Acidobacteriota bacterium]